MDLLRSVINHLLTPVAPPVVNSPLIQPIPTTNTSSAIGQNLGNEFSEQASLSPQISPIDNDPQKSPPLTPNEFAEYAQMSQIQHLIQEQASLTLKLSHLQSQFKDTYSSKTLAVEDLNSPNEAFRVSTKALIEVNKQIVIQNEQKTGQVYITSLDTSALLNFVANRNQDSKQPAYISLPQKLRSAWLLLLNGTNCTFMERYENDVATLKNDQQFLIDIVTIILSDPTVNLSTILDTISSSWIKSIKAMDKTEFLVNMATAAELAELFSSLIKKTSSQAALKQGILRQIQPLSFRNYLIGTFGDLYGDPSYSFTEMITHMISQFDPYILSERAAKFILPSRHIPDANLAEIKRAAEKILSEKTESEKATADKLKTKKCPNCKEMGHQTKHCKVQCSIHGSTCTAIHVGVCHYEAFQSRKGDNTDSKSQVTTSFHMKSSLEQAHNVNSIRNRPPQESTIEFSPLSALTSSLSIAFLPTELSTLASSNELLSAFVSTLPTPPVAIFDTGTNILCVNDNIHPDTITQSSNISSVRTADDTPTNITHKCSIGKTHGILTPHFSKTLVPASAITDNAIAVIETDKLHFIANSPEITNALKFIIESPDHILTTTSQNGLYPLTAEETAKLCNLRQRTQPTFDAWQQSYANTTYFTIKLDKLGELVRYWHETFGHASKQDMLNIIQHKI